MYLSSPATVANLALPSLSVQVFGRATNLINCGPALVLQVKSRETKKRSYINSVLLIIRSHSSGYKSLSKRVPPNNPSLFLRTRSWICTCHLRPRRRTWPRPSKRPSSGRRPDGPENRCRRGDTSTSPVPRAISDREFGRRRRLKRYFVPIRLGLWRHTFEE